MLATLPNTPRVAMIVVFAAFGAAVGSLAGSMPAIMRNASLNSETVGFGLTISTLMTVSAMVVSGQLARYVSNRAVLLTVLPIFALVLLAYLTAQSELWFYLAIIPLGLAFGVTDLFMNAEAAAIEHDLQRPVFTAFHGAVSVGIASIAIAASFISTTVGTWATGLLAMACIAGAWIMVHRSVLPRHVAGGRTARIMSLPNKAPLTLLGLAAGLIIAAETAALLWSAALLDELAPSLAAIAGLGAAFFGICNAAVRFPGDALRARFGDLPLMTGSIILAIAGFAALGFTSSFAGSVAAFAMVGLGTAVLIPCVFAMAAGFVPGNRAGSLSFVSLMTVLPRTLAPWFVGVAAASLGMGFTFGLIAVALSVALSLILSLRWIKTAV